MTPPSRRALLSGLGAAALTGGVTAVAPQQALAQTVRVRPTTGHWRTWSHGGRTAYYHVYANGIDWTRRVGVLWFLDGDYYTGSQSRVMRPTGAGMLAIAGEANRRNLVVVAVDTPSAYDPENGYTWWVEQTANGDFFRAFAAWFNARHTVSWGRQWMYGYSGGAELIAMELMARRQTSWMNGGGAIILAGGDRPQAYSAAAVTPEYRALAATWIVGSRDTAGQTNPPTWSALTAATAGQRFYAASGFSRARLDVLAGYGHLDYDLAAAMRAPLDLVGIARLR